MLASFYKDLIAILKSELQNFGFTDLNFGLGSPDKVYPFIGIEDHIFSTSSHTFKKRGADIVLIDKVDLFDAAVAAAENTPFNLNFQAKEITEVSIIKNNNNQDVALLSPDKYSLSNNSILLKVKLVKNDVLKIDYKTEGTILKDRFEQKFFVRVFEKDVEKDERLPILILPLVWGSFSTINKLSHSFSTNSLQSSYSVSNIEFIEQTAEMVGEVSVTLLKFSATGIISFSKANPGSTYTIQQAAIESSVTI